MYSETANTHVAKLTVQIMCLHTCHLHTRDIWHHEVAMPSIKNMTQDNTCTGRTRGKDVDRRTVHYFRLSFTFNHPCWNIQRTSIRQDYRCVTTVRLRSAPRFTRCEINLQLDSNCHPGQKVAMNTSTTGTKLECNVYRHVKLYRNVYCVLLRTQAENTPTNIAVVLRKLDDKGDWTPTAGNIQLYERRELPGR